MKTFVWYTSQPGKCLFRIAICEVQDSRSLLSVHPKHFSVPLADCQQFQSFPPCLPLLRSVTLPSSSSLSHHAHHIVIPEHLEKPSKLVCLPFCHLPKPPTAEPLTRCFTVGPSKSLWTFKMKLAVSIFPHISSHRECDLPSRVCSSAC